LTEAERKEHTMSDDERSKKRKEHEDEGPDVEAHIFDDDLGEPDPERKRKRKEFEEGEDADLHRKRK
jgi:hypothetical protein